MSQGLSAEDQLENAIQFSYEKVSEACLFARITLQDGNILTPTDQGFTAMLQHYRDMVKMKPPKKKSTVVPTDWKPETVSKKGKS